MSYVDPVPEFPGLELILSVDSKETCCSSEKSVSTDWSYQGSRRDKRRVPNGCRSLGRVIWFVFSPGDVLSSYILPGGGITDSSERLERNTNTRTLFTILSWQTIWRFMQKWEKCFICQWLLNQAIHRMKRTKFSMHLSIDIVAVSSSATTTFADYADWRSWVANSTGSWISYSMQVCDEILELVINSKANQLPDGSIEQIHRLSSKAALKISNIISTSSADPETPDLIAAKALLNRKKELAKWQVEWLALAEIPFIGCKQSHIIPRIGVQWPTKTQARSRLCSPLGVVPLYI